MGKEATELCERKDEIHSSEWFLLSSSVSYDD